FGKRISKSSHLSAGIAIADPVTAVSDELVAAPSSVWRPNAEIPLEVPRRTRALVLRPRIIRYIGVVLLLAYPSAWVVRLTERKYYVFSASYLRWARTPPPAIGAGPKHIFFLFVDHFEPSYDADVVRHWLARYRVLASPHRD